MTTDINVNGNMKIMKQLYILSLVVIRVVYWNTFVYKMQSEQAQAYSQYYPYKLILEEHGVLEVKLWPPQASCIETERGISGACGEFTKCLKQLSCRLYINCASVPRRIDARCFEKKWSQQKRSHLILIIVIKKKKMCIFWKHSW